MTSTHRRLATSLVIVAALSIPMAVAARSSPSRNGRITFGRFDPALGDFSTWIAEADGSRQERLTTVPSFFSDWSPDGRRIAYDFFDRGGNEHVAVIPADGGRSRQLTTGAGIQEVPRWSPDGKWITFDASPLLPDDAGFTTSIWLMRPDGTHQHQVTADGFDVEPVFSPDGRSIAFGRIAQDAQPGDQMEAIYVVDRAGGRPRQVVPPTQGLEHPDWSPDGRWITYNIGPESRRAPNFGSVLEVHPDGSGMRVLAAATPDRVFFKPVWSPDGRQLLSGCADPRINLDHLCEMNSDGTHVHVVVDGPLLVNFPAWGPAPDRD